MDSTEEFSTKVDIDYSDGNTRMHFSQSGRTHIAELRRVVREMYHTGLLVFILGADGNTVMIPSDKVLSIEVSQVTQPPMPIF